MCIEDPHGWLIRSGISFERPPGVQRGRSEQETQQGGAKIWEMISL